MLVNSLIDDLLKCDPYASVVLNINGQTELVGMGIVRVAKNGNVMIETCRNVR